MVCELPERKCNFPSDRKMTYYQTYSRTNCEIERSIAIYKKLCNCKPYYFPGKQHMYDLSPRNVLFRFLSSWFVVAFHKLLCKLNSINFTGDAQICTSEGISCILNPLSSGK